MKKIIFFLAPLYAVSANAEMKSLDNEALQQVDGQAGVNLGLVLRLNQVDGAGNFSTTPGTSTPNTSYDVTNGTTYANMTADPRASLDCTNIQFCRLAVAVAGQGQNSTYSTTSPFAQDANGNIYWLVLKGLQGYINIPQLGLDVVSLTSTTTSGSTSTSTNIQALQLSLSSSQPIEFRHFGFAALGVEVGTGAGTSSMTPGYLNEDSGTTDGETYVNGLYNSSAGFDSGREVGMLGLDIHGNMAVNANIAVFGCNGSTPRR